MRRHFQFGAWTGCVLMMFMISCPQPLHELHNEVIVETANLYTRCFGSGTDLGNSNQSGTNFLNQLTSVNSLNFAVFAQFQDSMTWDTDFLDPDTAGANSQDDDTDNFDKYGLAISFFQGHGAGSVKPATDQVCTLGAQCTQTPPGASGNGLCVKSPAAAAKYGTGNGVCQYTSTRGMAVCGSNDANGHAAWLSPNMAFGETPAVGPWRGAGTNGGTSLAIVKMSFGMMTFFPSEWTGIFAGLHQYDGVMVSWGDSEDSLAFGDAVAAPYTANPSASVSAGYVNAISSVTDGGGCGESFGGGFNGCGCHVAMTVSNSQANAGTAFQETWADLKNDNVNQNAANNTAFGAGCNYNPLQYPWWN